MRQILVCALALVVAATVSNAAQANVTQIGQSCRVFGTDSPPPDWPTPNQPPLASMRNFDSPPPDWPTPNQPPLASMRNFDSPPPDWPTPKQPSLASMRNFDSPPPDWPTPKQPSLTIG